MTRIILLYLLTTCFYSFGQEKTTNTDIIDSKNSLYIDLTEYDINKQKVDYISDLDFKNSIVTSDLKFFPNKYDFYNVYKSSYQGKVKQIKTLKKRNDSFRIDKFNDKGYLIESEYSSGGNFYYTYDKNDNLIKEIKIKNGDTVNVKNIYYNTNGKIEKIIENNLKEKKDYEFNLDVLITYDGEGRPTNITNNNPKRKYTKEISYKDNKVTIVYKSKNIEDKEIHIYSSKYKLLKEENQNYITINKYDESGRLINCMTYRDNEYCCTDFYKHDNKGNVTEKIFTNHLKNHKEITTYKYEFDSLQNITYELSSNNVSEKEYETYYEIEYFK
ncbi:hypothetical protein [Chryseobacterium mulctrae]|uniref:hypothetical protein n=1 Tax=Chryseobacterium mulctrae TaxID=2576777 RepID=UPI0011167534|nr:hypothetical protein [Chryseobacterium mulctrae]